MNLLQHTSMLKIERICYSLDTFLLHKRFAYCTGNIFSRKNVVSLDLRRFLCCVSLARNLNKPVPAKYIFY